MVAVLIEKSCHSLLTSGIDFFSFHRGNELIKEASYLDEPIEKFAKKISAEDGYSWILLHAIGSGEYYDSNRNGDITYEKALCHVPPNWSGDPEIDRIITKTWDYGYPTFYNGYLYAQHINKDPEKALGVIEFVHWNKHMHRVELVIKISHKRAGEFGGDWALRRLDKGDLLDASIGMRVPFDVEVISADYEAHNRALATFDPKIHKSPAHAVLMYHKMHPITGLSVTKDDYTDLGKHSINKVFPDGKKVMLDNTFPRFFDISFVFIGAEKPAKVMYKFASGASKDDVRYERVCIGDHCESFVPSGAVMYELEKTASISSQKSASVKKESDISKEVGSTFNPKAIGKHCDDFEDLPKHVLDSMGKSELDESLSTSGLSGVILKPKEFQRVVLIKLKMPDMADKLEESAQVFSPTDKIDSVPSISHDSFDSDLFSALKDFLPLRSVLSPFTGIPAKVRNITIITVKKPTLVKNEVLDKIAASYNGYRKALYEHFQKEASLAISQNLLLRNELFKYGSEGNFISNDTIRLLREF